MSEMKELATIIENLAKKKKKDIEGQLSKETGLSQKDIKASLPGAQSAFKGAEIASKQGADPTKMQLSELRSLSPGAKKEDPKQDDGGVSNQDKVTLGLIGILPSLIGYAFGGYRGGEAGGKAGEKGAGVYIDGMKDNRKLQQRQYERAQDVVLKNRGLDIQETTAKGLNDNRKNLLGLKERQVAAQEKTAEGSKDARDQRVQGMQISKSQSLFQNPTINKEVTKLNAARGVQSLIAGIKSGELKDSKNISKQLTNMIATIELGTPGGQGDRDAMGVSTLYTSLKGALGYVGSSATSTIPKEYLDQLESEAFALGDRAAKNYKALTDSSITGADLSLGDPSADKGQINKLARQRQAEFLKQNGYDIETGDRIVERDPVIEAAAKEYNQPYEVVELALRKKGYGKKQ